MELVRTYKSKCHLCNCRCSTKKNNHRINICLFCTQTIFYKTLDVSKIFMYNFYTKYSVLLLKSRNIDTDLIKEITKYLVI